MVYGTGWYYPSSVFYGPYNRPHYWHYRSPYGRNIGYHPVGAYYGGRSPYYNPWGGWYGRTTVTITSPTVNFNHGYGSAWEGPLQTTPGDPSETASKSLDAFLPKKKVDGKEEFISTKQDRPTEPAKISASSLYMSATLSSNMFSGPDGEVYKNEEDGWSQYSDGNWNTMQAIARQQPVEKRTGQKTQTHDMDRFLPAHKRTLSRSELDRQEMARIEGMDQYSKYRTKQDSRE